MDTLESVKVYYGEVLKSKADLQTGACCSADTMPPRLRELVAGVHPEVRERFYGCGSPIPDGLEGLTVLDLGCGSGRDCFVLSKLVGPAGRVIGVDMTDAQLEVARRHVDHHTKAYGYHAPNVRFVKGYLEDLRAAGIETASVDAVVSNCVLNLSPDKPRAFAEMLRVLKAGGELLFSDVFARRRVPAALQEDPVLVGECLGGALYHEDFRRLLHSLGVPDYRVVSRSPIGSFSDAVRGKIGRLAFDSLTIRAFKVDGLEDRCEDYGQVAVYLGTLEGAASEFVLDATHAFEAGRPVPVCRNTALMLQGSRYARHFRVEGDGATHYGLFDCGRPASAVQEPFESGACC